jgi:Na+-transporting NADH:ubiquinone oxidoreductase subunit NqrC
MASIFDIAASTIVGGAGAGSIVAKIMGAQDEQKQLNREEQMVETAAAQKATQRTERMRQVLASSQVKEAARGVSLASPSFQMVQRSSFEKFNDDKDAAALNLSFQKEAIASQRKNVRDKEITGIFGTVLSTASSLATII